MKKILFLQANGNSFGGVWAVNKTVGEELAKKGYQVEILGLRNAGYKGILEYSPSIKVSILNNNKSFNRVHLSDVKQSFKKKKIINSLKLCCNLVKDRYELKKDYIRLKKYIINNNYDYVIVTHYELLDAIPKNYLTNTFYEHHTSLKVSYSNNAIRTKLNKYKDKVNFIWLTKSTCDYAIEKGFLKSTYIYNPVKFTTSRKSNVIKNKKLVTIARISSEKRIDLMIKIVDDVLKKTKYKDWTLEIYGDGDLKEQIISTIFDKNKIKFMGKTSNPMDVLLSSSINLNTSLFEGFSMTILEAQECGVPTLTFDFGESVSEEIIQNKTGIYVEQNNIEEYKKNLCKLMDDLNLLEEMSINCKKNSKNFHIDNIINFWIQLFEKK